jgi:hypothetical protein
MAVDEAQLGHFYCGLFVESICIRCGASVAKAPTRHELTEAEENHRCQLDVMRLQPP